MHFKYAFRKILHEIRVGWGRAKSHDFHQEETGRRKIAKIALLN